ncbi:MAG: flagellar assembly protein FliW, partial [Eubacteriales bacterium]|nr:flagellar assembly protein FliW [Eubacteriales bacterium]
MAIKTKFFGELEIDENKLIIFKEGIPGFENLTKFLFMTDNDENSPFCWLQSIEDLDIVFTLFDIYRIMEEYDPKVFYEELINTIGEFEKEDILIYT